jgi:type IV secretory pathway VirB10-like protein
MARFAERHGIDRKRATLAAALLGSLLIVSLIVMNQRIQGRRASAAQQADSTALVPSVEPAAETPQRAAWADPREARKLAADTLPSVPEVDSATAGEYVPLGRDVGPGGYSAAERGDPVPPDSVGGIAGTYAEAGGPGSTEGRPPTPEEVRRAGFSRAVVSRQLRPRRAAADADSGQAVSGVPASASPGAELKPFGPAQAEEDRRAADEAAQQLAPRPQASAPSAAGVSATFASYVSARPCRPGERILSPGMITATLVSSINSEVPGPVFARIGRDVYDASLRCVILPAGSLLVGRYPDGLNAGSSRLIVLWEQVVLDDGSAWPLPSLPAADRQGALGVAGSVDRKTRETFETAALLSAFGAALEYATPGGGQSSAPGPGGYPAPPSARDRAVGAATEPFRGAAERLLDRATSIRPVLRLQAGQPITVIIPAAVDLDRPVTPPPPAVRDTVPTARPSAPSA